MADLSTLSDAELLRLRDEQQSRLPAAPVGFWNRLGAKSKATSIGSVNFLRETVGDKFDVQPIFERGSKTNTKNILLTDKSDKTKQYLLDPENFSVKESLLDVADIIPEVVEGVPGAVGSAVGAAIGGLPGALGLGAVGDTLGSAGRIGFSAMLPGSDEMTFSDAAKMAAVNAAGGAAGELGGRAIGAGLRRLSPAKRQAAELLTDPVGQVETTAAGKEWVERSIADRASECRALFDEFRIGAPDLGEATGNRVAVSFSALLSQHPKYAQRMANTRGKKLFNLERAVGAQADALSKKAAPEAGEGFARVQSEYLGEMIEWRRGIAKEMFGDVDAAAGLAGNREIIPMGNTIKKLEEMVTAGEQTLTPDQSASVADWATKQIGSIAEKMKGTDGLRVSATDLQNMLSSFGEAAASGGLIKDIQNPKTNRRIAAALFGALQKDLDEAIKSGSAGDAGMFLREARDTYSDMSTAIDSGITGLGAKIMGLAEDARPEAIVDEMLRKGRETQTRSVMRTAQKMSPAAADEMRGSVLRSIAEKSTDKNGFSAAKFATNIHDNYKQIAAVFSGDNKTLSRVMRMGQLAKRLSDTAGMVGSATQPRETFAKVMRQGGISGAVADKMMGMVDKIIPTLNDAKMYKITQDVDGLEAFLGLLDAGALKRSRDAAGLYGRLVGRVLGAVARDDFSDRISGER